ncbi:MAG: TonB family protein [Candidatus Omnitrophica bacterium]|nr:TonB family protein [Candidatus Omnitrophota bacterium]
MKRFYWGLLFSGAVHVGLLAAPAFLTLEPPSVPVMTGENRIRVVFLEEPKSKEIKKPEDKKEITPKAEPTVEPSLKPIEVNKKEVREETPKMTPLVSLESSGVEKSSADYTDNPAPRYPRAALLKNIQGRLVLLVEVSAGGDPLEVRVERSSGYAILDQAALEAVRKWKFTPAKVGTIAIRSQVRIPVQFKIVNR